MTPRELQELNTELKDMNKLGRILLFGAIPALILPVWVYFYKNEEFVVSIICFISITLFFAYTAYWKPVTNLKKDIELQISDSITTIVSKIHGADTNTTIKTESKFKLSYLEFDRFNIPIDKLNINTKLEFKYARHSKHIFSLAVID